VTGVLFAGLFRDRAQPQQSKAPEPIPSTVGVRANWTCRTCRTGVTTYQVLMVDGPIDLPAGWEVREQATYCSEECAGKAPASAA
jgi:hypothetical protein